MNTGRKYTIGSKINATAIAKRAVRFEDSVGCELFIGIPELKVERQARSSFRLLLMASLTILTSFLMAQRLLNK
jgi:hypothetical protein